MGLTKINQILKKYKGLYKKHQDSWEDSQKRIRAASKKIEEKMNDPEKIFICDRTYRHESQEYQLKGNKLLDAMMKELEGHEIFPKKNAGDSKKEK
jgi:hypothetical protein